MRPTVSRAMIWSSFRAAITQPVGAPGYNAYFLWLMAGEHQGFYRSSDAEHAWVGAVENMLKKQ